MFKQIFYKDIRLIVHCKGCGLMMRPPRGSLEDRSKMCYECWPEYFKELYKKFRKPYIKRLSPEKLREMRRKELLVWRDWVKKFPDKRRQQALKSYHRRKRYHKDRKHRRTKNQEVQEPAAS